MEIPRKHDKKNSIKTLNIGSGGIGGVLLLGGALVTATIVSTLAYRSRSQRRSSSEYPKKKMSVDAPKKFSEKVTSMKEIQTEKIKSLTQDKKYDEQVQSGDSNEDTIDLVVGEDRENKSIRVDSAFESEEQVVMAVEIEEDLCLKKNDGGGEEQKQLMLTDNENEEHVDANSLVSDEGVVSIEEYEAVEVPLKDIGTEDDNDHQGTLVMNEAVGAMEVEDKLQVRFLAEKENNGHDEIILENCEGDFSDETCYADQIVHELVTEVEEEAIDVARLLDGKDEIILENCEGDLSDKKDPTKQIMKQCDQQMECSRKQLMDDHEVADAQKMQVNQVCETLAVACVMNALKEAVDDQTTAKEDTPPSRLMKKEEKDKETAQKVEEQVTVDDEAAKVDDRTDNPPSKLMSKDENDELVKKDEIPHVESVKEGEDSEEDVTVKAEPTSGVSSPSMQEKPTPEAKNSNHKNEENMDENQKILNKSHSDSEEDFTVKAEPSSGVSPPSVQEEPTPEAKMSNHKMEENMEKNQTILGKKNYDSEEDVTVKAELSSSVVSSTMQEEPTPEAKISNHKTEENMDENQKFLVKNDNERDVNGVVKEQAFASEPWNYKLMAWSALISVWCLCHWYSELPFPELSRVGSLLIILISLAYRNRATRRVKYE